VRPQKIVERRFSNLAHVQLVLFETARAKRVRVSYDRWEDFHAGMYLPTIDDGLIGQSRALLSGVLLLGAAMRRVAAEWPVSAGENLGNHGVNRRAWLGQAACCLELGAPAICTKLAWHTLSEKAQNRANAEADSVIQEWINGAYLPSL